MICLCLDPIQERRPLAKQLLEHEWFEGMDRHVPQTQVDNTPTAIDTTAVTSTSSSTSPLPKSRTGGLSSTLLGSSLSSHVKLARHESQQLCQAANIAIVEALAMLSDIDNIEADMARTVPRPERGGPMFKDSVPLNEFEAPKPVPKTPTEELGLIDGLLEMVSAIDLRY